MLQLHYKKLWLVRCSLSNFKHVKQPDFFLGVSTAVHKITPAQKTKFIDHFLQQILFGVIPLEGGCVDSLPGWRLTRGGMSITLDFSKGKGPHIKGEGTRFKKNSS